MKDTKKIIIIIFVILCAIFTIVALFLGSKENNNNSNNNLNNNNNENYEISKYFTKVNEYEEFFSIQNTINDNLELTIHFNALEMYSNNDSKLNYYFVRGRLSQVLMDDETYDYEESVVYLLMVDKKTNKYILNKLNNNIVNLENYVNSYNVTYKEINGEKKLKSGTQKIDVILSNYIDYYKNLLFFDPQTAYNMLTNTTKSKFNGYADFYNNLIEVYESISSNVYGYNIEEKEDYIIYNINDNNYNKITIIEYGIMDFKIEF